MISLFNMAPKQSANVLSRILKRKKAVRCLTETGVLDKLHSGTSYSAIGVNSVLMNQQYTLNKVSLNRNTHKTRLCTDLDEM